MRRVLLVFALLTGSAVVPAFAQLPEATRTSIDEIVHKVLTQTHVPAASIAVVQDGKVAYVQAYGDARVTPPMAATTAMRFKIASNSKQIAAAATVLLAEEHK